ncbi:MAG TPA: hypothetical protein VF198_16560 [Vicinamibacterales bacterium]
MTIVRILSVSLVPALALLLAPAPSAAGESAENMHLKIRNRGTAPVTVRVLHSDGKLQKQETVKPGDNHRFIFEWCASCCGNDKQRKFEVFAGSVLIAAGDLYMSTKKVITGPQGGTACDENNQMTVTDANAGDAWIFSTSYENQHRTAVLTVTNQGS